MRVLEALPPGHPSSPYQADGTRRSPEPSLRSLELPIPDEMAEEWGIVPRGEHGKDAGGGSGYADGWYGDFTGGGDDRSSWNGDGSTGRNAAAAGERARKTDAPRWSSTERTEENYGQADGTGDVLLPEEPRERRGTADNTAGRSRNDNPQTADAVPHPEAIHRNYWTEIPRFKQMWADHESAWPKESQPAAKVDRSADPPGSWRSDSNLFLSPDSHVRAKNAINRSRDAESYITTDLQNVVDESPARVELVGLEFRSKGEERLKEKVAETLRRRPDSTPEEAVRSINDAIRYTVQLSREHYVEGHRTITDRLQEGGYERFYQENHWDDPMYKGINTRWLAPNRQKFELQFHTPESYHAKQEITHEAYERLRNRMTTRAEAEELRAFQQEVSSWVPVPDSAKDIPSSRKDNR